MRITLNNESVFYYLNNDPPLFNESTESWKETRSPFKFPVNLNFGSAELPLPLRNISLQFSGLINQYSGVASIFSRKLLPSKKLADALRKSFSEESGYSWSPIRPSSIEGYIYENGSREPSFAVDMAYNSTDKKLPFFLIYMGFNGASMRSIRDESTFIQELDSFAHVTSLFVRSCLSLHHPQKSKDVEPVIVPSKLELTCVNIKYG